MFMDIKRPDPLRIFFIANDKYLVLGDDLYQDLLRVDLVVSLGGVNLEALSESMAPGKPGLAVLGPGDYQSVPSNFAALHGTGFLFRDEWRIGGLSGAPKTGMGANGLYLDESESEALLKPLAATDIFLSHSPPATLEKSNINPQQGFESLGKYLNARPPIYHFYAHPFETTLEDRGNYVSIGVCGKFICDGQSQERPLLEYV